ncbi:hypothetical protein EV175_002322, partial [Coemansia sp. RSA 1933]
PGAQRACHRGQPQGVRLHQDHRQGAWPVDQPGNVRARSVLPQALPGHQDPRRLCHADSRRPQRRSLQLCAQRRAGRGLAHLHPAPAPHRQGAGRSAAVRVRVAWPQGRRRVPHREGRLQAHRKGVPLAAKDRQTV